jgi:hypothetical protein
MRIFLALAALLLAGSAIAAPAVSLTVSPSVGAVPYTATLTWSVTNAATCAASDGWTGNKALTGSQQVTVTATTKYTLTCAANDGSTTTTWLPPTTNVDGTPITDLAGFNLYRGTSLTNLTRLKSLNPNVLTYIDSNLAPGNYYYQVTSVDAASNESARANSTPYPVAVKGSSTSASTTATGDALPSAPTGVITTSVDVNVSVNITTGTAPTP